MGEGKTLFFITHDGPKLTILGVTLQEGDVT